MRYIQNGNNISPEHSGQIAHSYDGLNWGFFTKAKIKDITVNRPVIKLWFDDGTHVPINTMEVLNQEWSLDTQENFDLAVRDISAWLNESSVQEANKLLTELKLLLNGGKGFKAITPATGAVIGSFYLVRTLEETVFSSLEDNGVEQVGDAIPAAFVFPEKELITTSVLETSGINRIQLSSGKVMAYYK